MSVTQTQLVSLTQLRTDTPEPGMRILSPSLSPGDRIQVISHYPNDEWLMAYDAPERPLGSRHLIIVDVLQLELTFDSSYSRQLCMALMFCPFRSK